MQNTENHISSFLSLFSARYLYMTHWTTLIIRKTKKVNEHLQRLGFLLVNYVHLFYSLYIKLFCLCIYKYTFSIWFILLLEYTQTAFFIRTKMNCLQLLCNIRGEDSDFKIDFTISGNTVVLWSQHKRPVLGSGNSICDGRSSRTVAHVV